MVTQSTQKQAKKSKEPKVIPRTAKRSKPENEGNVVVDQEPRSNRKLVNAGKLQQTGPLTDNEDASSSCVTLPQIVTSDEQYDELRQDHSRSEDSTGTLNRFSTLPPIPSDIMTVKAAGPVGVGRTNSRGNKSKLPPIHKQQMDEKPESKLKKASNHRKGDRPLMFEVVHGRDIRNRMRLERHAKKRKETIVAFEAARAAKIEKHLTKMDLAEKNKEEMRSRRKRKLEYEEEKRRKAKERLDAQKYQYGYVSREEKLCMDDELSQQKLPKLVPKL
eukprot:Seg501.8 transcript_id=Seg501.8/GoldUCD/mRNA.D3Y31 product="hypothetical protein" protein_id=Seg501.8/GoldUCD/D3Y31